ncbi:MAG TPA: carboxymuconolactone decarboxylase family protein [Polyangia bacterium]|nr:carboxymuconolactone decarboxylase family protein [Polyangia bacterium]
MSHIPALDVSQAQGKTADTLAGVQRMLGATPNMFRVAAQAPSVLEWLVNGFTSTARGTLRAPVREAIALAVSQANACDYCLSAHSALGAGAGMSEAAVAEARRARSAVPKTDALLRFARAIVDGRGNVSDAALAEVRLAGASDAELLEVVANVGLTMFTNYFNLVVGTEIDFPLVRAAA